MKQFKFLMVAFSLLMGISLTSCLNSDSNTTAQRMAMAKVYSNMGIYYSFKTTTGVTITPTSASISSMKSRGVNFDALEGKVVSIMYQWDTELMTIPNDATKIDDVELVSIESLNNAIEIVEEKGVSSNDSVENAAIITMEGNDSFKYAPSFFDRTTLFLPINYIMYNKYHYLTLVYYPNEEQGDVMRLYLRHNDNKDVASGSNMNSLQFASSGYYGVGMFYHAYDMTRVFGAYGKIPEKIEIVAKENQYSLKLDDPQTEEKVYTVTFKEETDK